MATKNNMKISVENYGPIAKAENIELCPLTVFVGPSNTGKSYLAILIYALFKPFETGRFILSGFRKTGGENSQKLTFDAEPIAGNVFDLLTETLEEKTKDIKLSDFPEELQQWVNEEIAKAAEQNFQQEISRCMGMSQKEGRSINTRLKLNLEDDQKRLMLAPSLTPPKMEIKNPNLVGNIMDRLIGFMHLQKDLAQEIAKRMFLYFISEKILHPHGEVKSFYLPAARTGIMQSQRAIAGALVQQANFAETETFSVPTLSGIVSDFLQEIIAMDTNEIPCPEVEKIAREMERDILHGSIKSKSPESNQYPQFSYQQNGVEVPLLRSSSMVSELAPVVLFIRHRVEKGDLLIIEEPEAHLHPEAQRNIAKAVVHLVQAGVRVMVTTHSDYFLDQLANYVRVSKLKQNERGDQPLPLLKEDQIGVYVFNKCTQGTITKRLDFDKENGFSPEDHDEVSSGLYNQTVEILEQLDQ